MKRTTRKSVPAATASTPTATASTAPKKRGRKKKSELQEIELTEKLQTVAGTRRSTRGRNQELSSAETSFVDESNASTLATDEDQDNQDSISIDTLAEEPIPLENELPSASSIEVIEDSTDEPSHDAIEPVPEPSVECLSTLEQKMSDVFLEGRDTASQASAPEIDCDPIQEMILSAVVAHDSKDTNTDDVEMAVSIAFNQTPPIEQQKAESQLNSESFSEMLGDSIEDTGFVRRSRRLQSIYTEPISTVAEAQPEPLMASSPNDGVQSVPNIAGAEQEVVEKPDVEMRIAVHHTDERLRRFDDIRDNIYMKKSDKKVCKVNKTMKCDCTITAEEVQKGELGCQFNCINRILYIECGLKCRCGEFCDNQQFQRYNYSECSVFDTITKGFGIRADRDIPSETFIIEYVGEVLDNKQFEKRAKKYSEHKNVHYYFMALKSNAIIDATKKGNISRFINHSCDPNAETQKWTVNGELRVGFFSRKDIKAGDEITFDYQYQRYGKEAQKCYCEAINCRGWIGENPDEVEDELVESPEADDTKSKTKGRKGRKPKTAMDQSLPEQELKGESESDGEGESAANNLKMQASQRKAARILAKKRQEYDDMEIKGEITDLTQTGLKNRDHTIRFSRLIVRAKNVEARIHLLSILMSADLPICRLFLDYNGLKLLHNWMCDMNVKKVADLGLCLEIMKTLQILPITNKTVLRTSKVLDRVEKWKNLDLEKKKMTKEERKQLKAEKKKNKSADKKPEIIDDLDPTQPENPDQSNGADQGKENIDRSQVPDENSFDELTELKLQVKKAASELLETWEELKEDFKIPKKQKQEIMIEHEREADDDWEDGEAIAPREDPLSSDRYKNRFGDESANSAATRTFSTPFKKQFDPQTKQQRRQMFERKVAAFDEEKRMTMLHENNCAIFALNPSQTSPINVPVRVNRVNGEYNTIDGRVVQPPPNYYQFKYEPLALSTNPDDYHLPPMDLPEHWRFALDVFGRIYYYHEKIRQPQWDAPIKILPLKVKSESEMDSPDSDESTTDTEDSEEEELRETLEMFKRKAILAEMTTRAVDPSLSQSGDADDDELEKKIMTNMMQDEPMTTLLQRRLKKKKRHGLVSIQYIRPRTEADKSYGRSESKRYKEVKEKIRQKKRRILKGEAESADGSSEDEDDDIALGASIESRKFVDELEKSEIDSGKIKKEAEKKLRKLKPIVYDQAEVKRQFRDEIKGEIAKFLQPYREDSCENGRITNDIDFNSLVNKITFSILSKESKHCQMTNSVLKATDSVKAKTKEYIKKYMGKFSGLYQRKEDEQDYANILNKF